MDEQRTRAAAPDDAAELRRRSEVLAMLARRRRRRRTLLGSIAGVAMLAVVGGSLVAWSAQARATSIADEIELWHAERDDARCQVAARLVLAVELESRAADVVAAAEHVSEAEDLLSEDARRAFRDQRAALRTSLDSGELLTEDDRVTAARWRAEAEASGDAEAFDVVAACTAEAAQRRSPVEGVTAERVDALAAELRELGDPRALDAARLDALDAAIRALAPSAMALAEGRAELGDLRAAFSASPTDVLASLGSSDDAVRDSAEALRRDGSPLAVLDLIESLALHVASAWMAEAWQLEADGDAAGAAERQSAAAQVQEAIAQAAPRPRPIASPAPPVQPSAPALPEGPRPSAPSSPAPQPTAPPSPSSPPVAPTTPPGPVDPPVDPSPEPEPEPEPPIFPTPVDPRPTLPDPIETTTPIAPDGA
ncbi:hypothetical protein [Agrococcus terreus]|uniref:DUF5667 domain-containing protein n=1 Tax=Agrococcus terreus TaxID=574649 RepID=A0ABQ2KLJ7_9MICO|nr:hypothetical protein [Agrococcus terreus]GGN85676.1 hypothetical protein GCM10010968_18690 [Agrococcus terreus]